MSGNNLLLRNKALKKVQALCSRSEKCVYDIHLLLQKQNIEDSDIQTIIEQLYEDDFLNDSRYLRCFVNDKIKFNKWGRQKVKYALKQKGFSDILIDVALAGIDKDIYKEGVEKLLRQKSRSIKTSSTYELKIKLLRFAVGRGFTLDEVQDTIADICEKS